MPLDGLGENCGVAGVTSPGAPAASMVYAGLLALQHRGQEAAGAAVGDGLVLRVRRGLGLVTEVLDEEKLRELPGTVGIGHVRYPTAGGSTLANAQPLLGITRSGEHFSLAHNGNLLGIDAAGPPGDPLGRGGRARTGSTDTQALVDHLASHPGPLDQALRELLPGVRGAYCLVLATRSTLYAARDPHGFRPLCLGRLPDGGWMVASETAALDAVGAEFVRDAQPGELLVFQDGRLRTERFAAAPQATCVFEHVYIARPDSLIGGRRVQQVRQALGAALAREAPVAADVVIPVPDTARPAAIGYARQSGVLYAEGFVRNHYLGRTFLRPGDAARRQGVRLKLNPVPEVVRGQRVIVVDDSIVRATSMKQAVAMLRAAGAAEVHVRVASAKIAWPCFFGVDISSREELIGHSMSAAEIGQFVGADSLDFLSVEAMSDAAGSPESLCTGCFTGSYPTGVPLEADSRAG
ncbi:amidophosphoribosyltransferase [Sphaerisporangium sp. TRM90804]|uniref:amidophosphoribosyltransferase n=1 Tax=Sphaerisporangium sp. TRM90804 TaxID=3031113 RepID=UPI00244CF09E|nr:amidophosphoribosyltransferase [Sphaerisporangium sp. TRM90804]MDH2427982.1 amidophosphoribosyltransferase [Sphaerisporangium sp. TRM90804]